MSKGEYGFSPGRVRLPRDRSRRAESFSVARLGRLLYRYSGAVLGAFVLLHVLGQGFLRIPALRAISPEVGSSFLAYLQHVPVVRGVVFFAVVFHFLYGLRIMLSEVGWRSAHRPAVAGTVVLALIAGVWEAAF
ncbi:MAG: hypothetical protein WD273_03070 [Trueperaceae bacterium]